MYSTCIFCHASLGSNESIEQFPVGHRLAFDASRGRLWVVCRRCERWNLTPLEERWEAIEECERAFSETKLRVSTDNIGLARLRDGLELVRIGSPQRPEMAAWRYGDQFGRRRRKHLIYTGAAVAAAAGLVVLGPVTGIIAGSSWGLWNIVTTANSMYQQRRSRARVRMPYFDEPVTVRLKHLNRVTLIRPDDRDDSWALRVPFAPPKPNPTSLRTGHLFEESEMSTLVHGDDALRVAGKLLPAINSSGAKRNEVDSAVQIIGEAREPSSLFSRYTEPASRAERRVKGNGQEPMDGHLLATLPTEVRLALEMATHEETERRALEGELAILEDAWQQAEEIAAIADDMFVSGTTRARLADLKRHRDDDG